MKPEIKARWVEALRSGRYKQGRGALRMKDDTYCCLGVLCDLIDPEGWGDVGCLPETPIYAWSRASEELAYDYLPEDLRDEVGLDEEDQSNLTCMNDDGTSFGEIADYIEKKC